jgi:2-iminobutanoate/2-iminopropanoate deaminase
MSQIDRHPSTIGTFSEVVTVAGPGTWIYVSGQVALDDSKQRAITADMHEQAHLVFDQIEDHLAARGARLSDVVRLTAYLTDLADYPAFSAARSERFADHSPASAAVGVASLLLGAHLEVDAVAFIGAQQ